MSEREGIIRARIELRKKLECRPNVGEMHTALVYGAGAGAANGVRVGGVAGAAGGAILGSAMSGLADGVKQFNDIRECGKKIEAEEKKKVEAPKSAPKSEYRAPVMSHMRMPSTPMYASAGRDMMMSRMLGGRWI